MTKVAEPDRWEADLLVQLDEAACDVGGVEHFAVLLGEDATGLHPGGAPLRSRILVDPAWPALDTVLADAEAPGHSPHQLLRTPLPSAS